MLNVRRKGNNKERFMKGISKVLASPVRSKEKSWVIEQLLPDILKAHRRMSLRAISRWLSTQDISISPVTLANHVRKEKQNRKGGVV